MKTTNKKDEWVSVYAPASVANVGPGFDCFGFSLGEPGDIVHARLSNKLGVRISEIQGDEGSLPVDVQINTAGKAALTIWDQMPELAAKCGIELKIEKGLPPCSGLGSSAASAVAGAMASMLIVERQTGLPYDQQKVLYAALAGEAVASGSIHADNIAPALLGGFTIVQSCNPLNIARFEPALDCSVSIVTPKLLIPTKAAREILPKEIPLRQAISNWANAASLVAALLTADEDLLRSALNDHIVEPVRARLIPGFDEAKKAAIQAGAYGCSISGAGPTLFALTPNNDIAHQACKDMVAVFARYNLDCASFVTKISSQGAKIV